MRSREHILAEVSKWLEAYAWLEEELGERADFRLGKARPSSDGAGPDAVAQAVREAVGLAPEAAVRDICGLLDRGGVKLLLLETTRDSLFGLSVGQRDGGPAVVVNTWERIFRVSYKTVLYRLVQSGREQAPRVWQAFQSQHRAYFGKTLRKADEPQALGKSEFAWSWGRAGEPAGLSRHDFMEDRLHRLVRQALERGSISLGRAAEILGLEREGMRRLAGEWKK